MGSRDTTNFKLVPHNDPKTNLDQKLAQTVELRIIDCINITNKQDDQYKKSGTQCIRVSMTKKPDFVDYLEEYDYEANKIIVGIEWNPFNEKTNMLKTVNCATLDAFKGG